MMDTTGGKPRGPQGIAALFDEKERKELFRKYLYLLGWVELAILLTCWLYQISDKGATFPWRLYFLIAFLAPVGITFLLGTVVVGFNRYFAEPVSGEDSDAASNLMTGKVQHLDRMVAWLRRVPFLGLLLLLAFGIAFFYKLDVILATVGSVGEKSVKIVLTSLGIIVLLASIFGLILIILNYRLRKSAMEYQYKGQVAERLGLVILNDNTVLNSTGKLLVNGKKLKAPLQLLPQLPAESKPAENSGGDGSISRPADPGK